MFKACGLKSGVSRLRMHPLRGLCAPRVVRTFATTLIVSGHHPRNSGGNGPWNLPWNKKRKPKPLAIETNELRSEKLRAPTLASIQPIEADTRLENEDEIIREILFGKVRDDVKEARLGDANEDSEVPGGQVAWDNKAADDDQGRLEGVPWRNGLSRFRQEITLPQDFHEKLNATLLKNIMRREPLLRGMPVYDSTFDAVRSGKNLFIETERSVRSLQYMLPTVQSILDFGLLKRRREVKPGAQLPPRPLSVLVICPNLGAAHDVEALGKRLVRGPNQRRSDLVEMMTLNVPTQRKAKTLSAEGFNVLISTPEFILQWLAMPDAKTFFHEGLQDVQTLIVDGKASSLRNKDFLELLKDVMEDLPLHEKTQRVIISDKHDPQLDEHLTRLVLRDDYEINREPRLEEVQEMQRAREKRTRQDIRSKRKATKGKRRDGKLVCGRAKERF